MITFQVRRIVRNLLKHVKLIVNLVRGTDRSQPRSQGFCSFYPPLFGISHTYIVRHYEARPALRQMAYLNADLPPTNAPAICNECHCEKLKAGTTNLKSTQHRSYTSQPTYHPRSSKTTSFTNSLSIYTGECSQDVRDRQQ